MQIDVFLDSVESALTDHNWHAALAVALILPDICAKLEAPSSTSRDRYVSWFNAYLKPKYVAEVRGQPEEFLSGEDLYALRCAYLHEGADDITAQDAQRALDSFRFVAPRQGWKIHLNRQDGALQLQVDEFCRGICVATRVWIQEIASHWPDVEQRMAGILTVESLDDGFTM